MPNLGWWAALSVQVALSLPPVAHARAGCVAGAGASANVESIDPELRLRFIDERLARTAHQAEVWTWGWGIGIGVATVGNLVPLAFVAPQDRIDWYVGAATTVVGIVPLLVAPLDVVGDSRALRARLTARRSTDDVCVLLADAEAKLVRDARNQMNGQRWWLHAANVALNSGVGLFLGLRYHHWGAGAYNAILGTAVGEAIILSQPSSSIADLRAYQAASFAPHAGEEASIGYATAF